MAEDTRTRQQKRAEQRAAAKKNGAPRQTAAQKRAAAAAEATAKAATAEAELPGVKVNRLVDEAGNIVCVAVPVGDVDPMAVDSILVKGLKGWRERIGLNLD